mmetsp:Transcript_2718/g.4036  ORF Transcript_2718/g.4036 Transcript_2718/m.4036 type:complete len:100 (+) Transcript_2718:1-300(+)
MRSMYDVDDMSTGFYSTYTTDTFFSTESWIQADSSRRLWWKMFSMLGFVVVVSTYGIIRSYLNTMAILEQARMMYLRDNTNTLAELALTLNVMQNDEQQ